MTRPNAFTQVVLFEVNLILKDLLRFVPSNIGLWLLAKIYSLLSKTLPGCHRPPSRNIPGPYPRICWSVGLNAPSTARISRPNRITTKKGSLIISKLGEKLPAPTLKVESKIEERSMSGASA
jgi:hypothetical protein